MGFGFAPVAGPPSARVVFVAEALGGEEAIRGEALVGAAGGVHSRVLFRAGVTREFTRAANCISCQPPGNFLEGAPWEHDALQHCRQYLDPVLAQVPDNGVVVTLGGTALKNVLNLHHLEGITVKDWHHTVNRSVDNRYWVVPTFHPSHLQRGAMSLLEVVTGAYKLADEVAAKGFVRSPARLVVDPEPAWYERWVDDHLAKVAADPDGVHFAIDTEFKEKIGGQDESEIDLKSSHGSPLLRVNGANSKLEGWTVPYTDTYIRITEKLLAGLAKLRGIMWAWNKYADWDHLAAAGHTLDGIECYDAMWAWHYLQSDLPRGLGFVSPLASDFGPWKHWAKMKDQEGPYAAADGVQTWRVGPGWILPALIRSGMWEIFVMDWHERDYYVLRPSLLLGVPADREKLEAFHVQLQQSQIRLLKQIKEVGAQGTLKPKAGYAKKPKGQLVEPPKCSVCGAIQPHAGHLKNHLIEDIQRADPTATRAYIRAAVYDDQVDPPKSMLGGSKKGKRTSEAKAQYNADEIRLVERTVQGDVLVCQDCGAVDVKPAHRCKVGKVDRSAAAKPVRKKARGRAAAADLPQVPIPDDRDQPPVHESADPEDPPPARNLRRQQVDQQRWFWQLPFNPDSWQQLLAYIGAAGHTPGTSKKTRKPTTDAASLKKLAADTGDQLYQSILDYRAVQKVDSTYAIGTLERLDGDDRVHPEIAPKPSTLRDSSTGPNLQNVVADKSGPEGLASGFRTCIVARDGLPPGVDAARYKTWAERWGIEQ